MDKANTSKVPYLNKALITQYIADNNLSIPEFCILSGIKTSAYKAIMNDEDVDLYDVFRISKLINVELYEMFISPTK